MIAAFFILILLSKENACGNHPQALKFTLQKNLRKQWIFRYPCTSGSVQIRYSYAFHHSFLPHWTTNLKGYVYITKITNNSKGINLSFLFRKHPLFTGIVFITENYCFPARMLKVNLLAEVPL